jgi:integrase
VGVWKQIDTVYVHPDLSTAHENLKKFSLKSKALNTLKSYEQYFKHFCKWCIKYNFKPVPSSDYHVSLYLSCMERDNPSQSKINSVLYGISHAHKLAGFVNPCNSPLVNFVKEGILRSLSTVNCSKEPLSNQSLQLIVEKYKDTTCLLDLRFVTMTLLSFSGFLRFNEVISLRRNDIVFKRDHIEIFIRESKTDQLKKGQKILISKTNNDTCPVKALEKYLLLSGISESSEEFLFRKISFCSKSKTYKLREGNPISYTRAREIFLYHISLLGLDRSKFGLHSLRSGGATAAALKGVPDRLIKKHGRWKTDKAKDLYVRESDDLRQSVSLNLGL